MKLWISKTYFKIMLRYKFAEKKSAFCIDSDEDVSLPCWEDKHDKTSKEQRA